MSRASQRFFLRKPGKLGGIATVSAAGILIICFFTARVIFHFILNGSALSDLVFRILCAAKMDFVTTS
jgi:hypothetical protein